MTRRYRLRIGIRIGHGRRTACQLAATAHGGIYVGDTLSGHVQKKPKK